MQDDYIKNVVDPMARSGYRTIAVAYSDLVKEKTEINEVSLTLI